jgi:polysaccharide biosynthesis protein PslG
MPASRLRIDGKTRARLAAALAAAGILLGVFASAAEALPAGFWGVVPQASPTEEQFQRLRRGGVRSVRIPLTWSGIQLTRGGPLQWSGTDALVKGAAAAGLEVLPFVNGAPSWAVPSVGVPGDHSVKAPSHLPASGAAAAAWSSFLIQAVERYGPGGRFWAENPGLPERPLRTWQIWNEENFKYFVAKPNPAEYGKLVRLSFSAIRGADPGAKVILGGMFSYPKGCLTQSKSKLNYCATDFLDQMYARTPGIKAKFNGVALHPYTTRYQLLTPYIEEFRDVLSENHDSGKGLWITELGWSSQNPTPGNSFAKGAAGQAQQLRGAFSLLRRRQVKWRLQRVYWFSVDDQAGSCNFCDGSGLFGAGFRPKKSWFEYVKFAGGTP